MTATTTFSTPTYKSTNTRTSYSQSRKAQGARPGLRSKVCSNITLLYKILYISVLFQGHFFPFLYYAL